MAAAGPRWQLQALAGPNHGQSSPEEGCSPGPCLAGPFTSPPNPSPVINTAHHPPYEVMMEKEEKDITSRQKMLWLVGSEKRMNRIHESTTPDTESGILQNRFLMRVTISKLL